MTKARALDLTSHPDGLRLGANERVLRVSIKGPRTVEAVIGNGLDPAHRCVYRHRYVWTAAGWTFRRALPMTKWGMDAWKEHQ